MVSDKNLASAVGGKTARACDSCIKKRARWYCAADDAFLCQACDASVHSANTLARRHERVRLKTASGKQLPLEPSWLHGFTRKARTPRHGKAKSKFADMKRNPIHLVPEMGPDENSYEENEEHEQLLYRVPVIDQFAAELCLSGANSNEGERKGGDDCENDDKYKLGMVNEANNLHGNVNYPCDMDLEEFAADVESLLGKGFDEESFDMETLGFMDCQEKDSIGSTSRSTGKVKFEEEEEMETALGNYQINAETDMTRETFELNFDDYDSPGNYEGHDQKAESGGAAETVERKECEVGDTGQTKKKILLALDYEGVIASWADQRSPWTTGDRPELDPNELWQGYMGGYGGVEYPYGEMGIMGGSSAMLDGGREARVSRYREKRRTRLFSKKIRYEVRKLNAEKRPRMKGRFVKRANFPLLTK